MKPVLKNYLPAALVFGAISAAVPASASDGPQPAPLPAALPVAEDKPYPGVITLKVDATDAVRRIIRVHETIPVSGGKDIVLFYPKWQPGDHTSDGPVDRVSGLAFTVADKDVAWTRDTLDMWSFHLQLPAGARTLDVDFAFLAGGPAAFGGTDFSSSVGVLEWINLAFYPAGYFTRDISIDASMTTPKGWTLATALERASGSGDSAVFKRTTFETLADSPVYTGRYSKSFDLSGPDAAPVRMNVFADRARDLPIKPEQIELHRALVTQAARLFGSHHYDHYDFLVVASEHFSDNGLEHHQSSEDSIRADYFANWDNASFLRDLLAHEYVHSWNGKFRRPADLWTPTYNTPMQDSLLWVYEGQTQYWGKVLAARSGLRTKAQFLDDLAQMAAHDQALPGRAWRPLQDTTNDEILYFDKSQPWQSWQRRSDYYDEGALIWLDADTLIRELSGGKRSLEDFAKSFFGIDDGRLTPVTYTFEDIVKALNAVQAYDWAHFLRERLDSKGRAAPLDGIGRGGYRLVFSDTPSDVFKSAEALSKSTNLEYSLGLEVGNEGELSNVVWGGPAFAAGLSAGIKILAVNGLAFDPDVLKDAVADAKTGSEPIALSIKDGQRYRTVEIGYHGGLRYPHLVRQAGTTARLDEIAKPKT